MDQYIGEFQNYLGQLNDAERDEVVSFYDEYLADGGFNDYDAAVDELGTPKQLARKVLADYSIRLLDGSPAKSARLRSQSEVKTIWLIVLAILSTPLTIPLALGVLGILIAVLLVMVSLFMMVVLTVVAVFFSAIAAVFIGIRLLGSNPWVALTYLGGGIAAMGAFLVLVPLIVWATRLLIKGILKLSRWLYAKLNRKNRAEERRNQ